MYLPWRVPEFGPPIYTSLTTDEAKALRQLAQDRNVLEVGAAYGYSTVLMAEVAESVTSIDPHDALNSLATLNRNLIDAKVDDRVDVRVGRFADIAPTLFARHFGLVFIDGDHSYEAVKHDLEWARRLVKPYGAVIAMHDYGEESCQGVKRALDEWGVAPTFIVDTLAVYSDPRYPVDQ